MEILILLILFLIIMGSGVLWLIVVPLLAVFSILFIIHILSRSLTTLILVPRSLLWIAFNPRIRQNHALEHATVNVIEENLGRSNLAGFAVKDGFKLRGVGAIAPETVYQAARIALTRLKSGEHDLAIHRRCGTSIMTAHFLFSIIVVVMFIGLRYFNFYSFLLALIVANFFAAPLGEFSQRYLTTSTNVSNVIITDMEVKDLGQSTHFNAPFREFYVHTARADQAGVISS